MRKYRVGIVGCGTVFPKHGYSIKNLDLCELVCVCDIKKERADEKALEFGCNAYTDLDEMLTKEKLDVLHICTPHYLHKQMAINACERGIHVITEKPMAINVKDAEEMICAADKNHVNLGVIFQSRYNASAVEVKSILEQKVLGNIVSAKLLVTWKRTDDYYLSTDWKGTWDKEGGGVVIDQAIHTIDLVNWLIESDIDYIDASIHNRTHKKIDVEDCAEGVIKYKNGTLLSFYANNYYSYDAPIEIEIVCTNGIIKFVGSKATIIYKSGKTITVDEDPNDCHQYGNVKLYWGVNHIKQIHKDESSSLIMNYSITIPVSRRRFPSLLEFLQTKPEFND